CRCTVCRTHCSTSLRGAAMTCAPVLRLASHLDIDSETNEPPKPKIAANTSRPPNWPALTPNRDMTTLARARTARLVARNKATRLNMLVFSRVRDTTRWRGCWIKCGGTNLNPSAMTDH